jgi:hypothetical protein
MRAVVHNQLHLWVRDRGHNSLPKRAVGFYEERAKLALPHALQNATWV